MYDDEAPNPITSNRSKYYKVAKFPTRNIKTPIVLVYGGSDSLVDINVMLKELPRHTVAKEIPHYEHLDFLWAQSVDVLVFPHVFEALEKHAGTASGTLEGQKERRLRSPGRYRGLLPDSSVPGPRDDDAGDESATAPASLRSKSSRLSKRTSHSRRPMSREGKLTEEGPSLQSSPDSSPSGVPPPSYTVHTEEKPSPIRSRIMSPPPTFRAPTPFSPSSIGGSQLTGQTSTTRPEGWWSSSDELANTELTQPLSPRRRASFTSNGSTASHAGRVGAKGITIGAGTAVTGVVEGEGRGEGSGTGSASGKTSGRSTDGKDDSKPRRPNVLRKKRYTVA
jgi:lysosomal acid lipase/cholesteryl ester hydrolase